MERPASSRSAPSRRCIAGLPQPARTAHGVVAPCHHLPASPMRRTVRTCQGACSSRTGLGRRFAADPLACLSPSEWIARRQDRERRWCDERLCLRPGHALADCARKAVRLLRLSCPIPPTGPARHQMGRSREGDAVDGSRHTGASHRRKKCSNPERMKLRSPFRFSPLPLDG